MKVRLLEIGVVLCTAVVPAFAGLTTVTPEPASILLIGSGIGALILIGRWKRSNK
jgi:PEP-CTERM putative exosortase interaction domain